MRTKLFHVNVPVTFFFSALFVQKNQYYNRIFYVMILTKNFQVVFQLWYIYSNYEMFEDLLFYLKYHLPTLNTY